MPEAFVHIGMNKAGSTSIQRIFAASARMLATRGILYPTIATNHSKVFFSAFCADPLAYHINVREGRDTPAKLDAYHADALAQVRRAVATQRPRKLVISGEDISKLDPAGTRRLQAYLAGFCDRTAFVYYFRPFADYVSSEFQQRIKQGATIEDVEKTPLRANHRGHLGSFIRVFGREAVHVRCFDPSALLHGDLMDDFCHVIGEDALADALPRFVSNPSWSTPAVALMSAVNAALPDFRQRDARQKAVAARATELLRNVKGPKLRCSAAYLERCRSASADSLAWLQEQDPVASELVDRGETGAAEPIPAADPALVAALLAACGEAGATLARAAAVARLGEAFPGNPAVLTMQAEEEERQGRMPAAFAGFARALQADPDSKLALAGLGRTAADAGAIADATALLERLQAAAPLGAPALVAARATLAGAGDARATRRARRAAATRLVLHIGQSKTGTSSIQRFLTGAGDWLQSNAVLYPQAGRQGEAHHRLAGNYIAPGRRPAWIGEASPEDIAAELDREIERSGATTALMSSEIFFDVPDLAGLRAFAGRYVPQLLVLVRRQDLWMDSLLQHQMKVLETGGDIDAWVRGRLASRAINYDAKLADWEQHFGVDAIRVGIFERASMRRGLVAETLVLAGLSLPAGFIEPPSVNEKMSRDGIALLQHLHFQGGLAKNLVMKLRHPLEEYSRLHPDPAEWKHVLSPAQRREVIARCAPGNARVCARYFPADRDALFLEELVDSRFEPYPGLSAASTRRMFDFLDATGADRRALAAARRILPADGR